MLTSFPQYYREYFYIFATTGKDVPYDMVDFLVKEFDLELVGNEITFTVKNTFIVKGSKKDVENCVEKYQEFFENWEKIDKRLLEVWDETDRLSNDIFGICDYFEDTSGKKKKEEHNEYVDELIKRLNNLKIL